MRKYIFIASLIFCIVGCKKYDDKSDVPKDDKKVVPVEILKKWKYGVKSSQKFN